MFAAVRSYAGLDRSLAEALVGQATALHQAVESTAAGLR